MNGSPATTSTLGATSEVGTLRTVLLHRPGPELRRLTPRNNDQLLFDGIPWVDRAQDEHDGFAQALRDHGVEVLYLADLLERALHEPAAQLLGYSVQSAETEQATQNIAVGALKLAVRAANALAERDVDITDLTTKVAGDADPPLYALMMEIAPPPGVEEAELSAALTAVAEEQGLELSLRPLETEAL